MCIDILESNPLFSRIYSRFHRIGKSPSDARGIVPYRMAIIWDNRTTKE